MLLFIINHSHLCVSPPCKVQVRLWYTPYRRVFVMPARCDHCRSPCGFPGFPCVETGALCVCIPCYSERLEDGEDHDASNWFSSESEPYDPDADVDILSDWESDASTLHGHHWPDEPEAEEEPVPAESEPEAEPPASSASRDTDVDGDDSSDWECLSYFADGEDVQEQETVPQDVSDEEQSPDDPASSSEPPPKRARHD